MSKPNHSPRLTIPITGMTCATCARRIERLLNKIDGVEEANVNFATEKATVIGDLPIEEIHRVIEKAGYGVIKTPKTDTTAADSTLADASLIDTSPRDGLLSEGKIKAIAELNRFLISVIFTLPLFIISMGKLAFPFSNLAQFTLATVVILWPGLLFFRNAIKQARHFSANMDTLIAIGAGAAYAYSTWALISPSQNVFYFETASMIITLILFGRYLEAKAKGKAGDAIRKLMDLRAATARVLRG